MFTASTSDCLLTCFRIIKLICTCANIGWIPAYTILNWLIHSTWTILIWSRRSGNQKFTSRMPKMLSSSTSPFPMFWSGLILEDRSCTCWGNVVKFHVWRQCLKYTCKTFDKRCISPLGSWGYGSISNLTAARF